VTNTALGGGLRADLAALRRPSRTVVADLSPHGIGSDLTSYQNDGEGFTAIARKVERV